MSARAVKSGRGRNIKLDSRVSMLWSAEDGDKLFNACVIGICIVDMHCLLLDIDDNHILFATPSTLGFHCM